MSLSADHHDNDNDDDNENDHPGNDSSEQPAVEIETARSFRRLGHSFDDERSGTRQQFRASAVALAGERG
jgi:hypothetical protein